MCGFGDTWGGGLSFMSYEYGVRKLKSLHFYKAEIQRDFGPECIPKETFTRTRAVCFCGERSLEGAYSVLFSSLETL